MPIPSQSHARRALHELELEECWRRLASRTVGRMAYVDRDGPVIVPLNYRVVDGRIWVRTASYDQLAVHLPHQQAAFEVDEVVEAARVGWSVLVRGRAEHVVVRPGGTPRDWPDPEPWPDGRRWTTFCLFPREVTGRELRPAGGMTALGHGTGSTPVPGLPAHRQLLRSSFLLVVVAARRWGLALRWW